MGVWSLLLTGLYVMWVGYRGIVEREIVERDFYGNKLPDGTRWFIFVRGAENEYGLKAVIIGWGLLIGGAIFAFLSIGHLLGFDMGLRTDVL